MSDINTVCLSGIIAGDIKKSKSKGVTVARFHMEVEGAGNPRPVGKFEIVAFNELADLVSHLSLGDRLVIVGYLREWRGQGMMASEIIVRKLIPLIPEKTVEVDPADEEDEEEEDED